MPTAPQVAHAIVLITQSAPDMARFHYALEACGLPPCQSILPERSDVAAFVRQAATAVRLSPPRLIIVDAPIPGMEGEEIVAALRTVPAYSHIPIILFSAVAETEGERRKVRCGATAFVPKPDKWEDFLQVVATMVQRWGGRGQAAVPASERDEESHTVKGNT